MVKSVITPKSNKIQISVPDNYIGKEIEVLLYAKDELEKEKPEPNQIKLSDKYKGIISKEKGEELNNHIKQMRKEWNSI